LKLYFLGRTLGIAVLLLGIFFLVLQGSKKREVEAKIAELKQLLERNPEEVSKLVLSWL
jgi:flagellar biosynthesis/type III secretory pathway M-ring protein FliF/YscJ